MKRLLLTVMIIGGFTFLINAQSHTHKHEHEYEQEQYSKIKISFDQSTGNDLNKLYQLGVDVEHGHYQKNLFFISDFSKSEIERIEEAGFVVEILIEDVVDFYQNQLSVREDSPESGCGPSNSTNYAIPANWTLGSMGGYFTYQEMLNHLDSMASKYPNLISARQPIDANNLTHDGYPIYWLRISDNPNTNEPEPEMLYDALHHAREPGSLSQLIFYMWYLLENYGTDPEVTYLVDNTELYFVPCVNPDGYNYNQQTNPNGGGMWRKNRKLNSTGNYGVDLNRNYGYKWGYDNTGSSGASVSDTYRGTSAFSEPETQNMRDFASAHQFRIALNYHTYGNLLVYPWGYNDQLTPDGDMFVDFTGLMTRQNNYLAGTGTQTVGYTVNGDSDDWMYGDTVMKNKIMSLTPEAGFSFWPASSEIVGICTENIYQNLTAAHLLLNYGEVTDQSDEAVASLGGHFQYNIKRYGFENGSLVVSFTPVSSNIVNMGAPQVFSLNQLQSSTDSVSYTLAGTIQGDDEIVFVVNIDNGQWIKRDTIRKYYQQGGGNGSSLFVDNLDNNQNWQNNIGNSWNVTTSEYYSSPRSMTDSPVGNYPNNSQTQMVSVNPIDLSGADKATLIFWAKWDIESGYDYVQVGGNTTNSTNYTPLCGLYTRTGVPAQAHNEPLYDGVQSTWVEEQIDLTDFLGGDFYLSFALVSDGGVREDGFYFDDVEITVTTNNVGTETISLNEFIIRQNRPNPTTNTTIIEVENIPTDGQLVIYNLLGQEVYRSTVQSNQIEVNTSDWNTGVYFYRMESKEGISESYKMEVMK